MGQQSPCAIRTILIDFGGVLAEEGFRDGLTDIALAAGRDPATLVPQAYEMAWTTGFVIGGCDTAGFWRAFRQATGLDGDDASLTETVLARFVARPWMFAMPWMPRSRNSTTSSPTTSSRSFSTRSRSWPTVSSRSSTRTSRP